MSQFLRTTALMLLVLSRAPAFAAVPPTMPSKAQGGEFENQLTSQRFKHSLSGLYAISTTEDTVFQPYDDFDVLYSKSHYAQAELETLCKSTALLTSTEAYFAGVKSAHRAKEKVNTELDGDTARITDLARATIVANDISSLMDAYETLSKEVTIVKVKNRFKTPAPSGYRDLNILVELPKTGIIAEVQFHLQAIADVKNGAEHKLYEQIQHIERLAKREQRSYTSLETAKINRIRSESKNLYQQAWQPYITTHIQAA
ncbi:RelA/SpoT domain-containing protein [Vibrio ziniensis]|uniref:RelA/SpoT domain-containing protein n=1 Tax=Vibrio ziniensis TaxID=2711221 RepID=A0A6G7CHD3_9VIBR|nr:RelA/SpoT domain-containing protein [Vibrio ziniensis]QIH41561.1 RelA/SpoT domain-containing protein [Vibrio ziniensis]